MQFIFGGAAASSSCSAPKAVAPLITDATLTIAAGAGSTAANLFAGITGGSAPYAGFVTKSLTCNAVKLVISYIVGDDGDACTPDVLTTEDVTVTIPANASGVALPEGYIAKITAQVVDSTGTGVNSALGGSVQFTSSRAGATCNDILVP